MPGDTGPCPAPLAVEAWNTLGGMEWAGLEAVAEMLGVRDIEALTLHSGIKRVVDYLVHSPDVGQVPVSQRDATVSLPASKGTIASLLSVTPEHFSRILHELQANGLIAVNRRQIHIPDVQRLACYG